MPTADGAFSEYFGPSSLVNFPAVFLPTTPPTMPPTGPPTATPAAAPAAPPAVYNIDLP